MHGCLLFTWTNQLVHGLGKWCTKGAFHSTKTFENLGWIHSQHKRIAVAFAYMEFFVLSSKTINNSSRQMRQLYAFVTTESTLGKRYRNFPEKFPEIPETVEFRKSEPLNRKF